MIAIGTILHPTDFSEHSDNAFRLACALARDYGARLVLLHVTPPRMTVYGGGPMTGDPEPVLDDLRGKLRLLEGQARQVRVESQVLEGDAVDMILRAAAETHSDLVVLGTHGRGALARLLLGSVAEAVMRRAPCPVLTVKTPGASDLTTSAVAGATPPG